VHDYLVLQSPSAQLLGITDAECVIFFINTEFKCVSFCNYGVQVFGCVACMCSTNLPWKGV